MTWSFLGFAHLLLFNEVSRLCLHRTVFKQWEQFHVRCPPDQLHSWPEEGSFLHASASLNIRRWTKSNNRSYQWLIYHRLSCRESNFFLRRDPTTTQSVTIKYQECHPSICNCWRTQQQRQPTSQQWPCRTTHLVCQTTQQCRHASFGMLFRTDVRWPQGRTL